ncbi:hypothetical protein [Paenibacillus polymyxa]|uniref:Phage XkdN-like protein n=1 Tax=Paenibacillus polymyxa (strain SC2) TaxID=886882 RepID=E3E560_PAEPS|nr:hypothetical protein [Paenibacillus polymyxa]ADO57420.1 hypothetical protein PPSC2_16215 [Paenibacillus polymyxa SC2]OBA05327.1 hypothetical protein A9P44_16220 [Paenibacillus polymyxa]WPQ55194.1 hypothetical protein SKN87_16530 [Paenibacillus polymyxa]CCI70088.1 hypothetical protein PPM_3279 [Paenibacillus polymyxa M1]
MSSQQSQDRLQKYLAKAKEGQKDDIITVQADGEDWSVKRLKTLDVRRSYDLALDEDGNYKSPYFNEIDVMIVKATEHEFDWNNKDLMLAYGATSKFELPPRILDNTDDYAVLSKAVRNFKETQDSLLNDAKNSSGETEKQAG